MKIRILIILIISMLGFTGSIYANVSEKPEISDIHTEINSIEIKVQGHQLVINNTGELSEPIYVYALTGQAVKSFEAVPGTTTCELPSGYYIVKTEKKSSRIIIR